MHGFIVWSNHTNCSYLNTQYSSYQSMTHFLTMYHHPSNNSGTVSICGLFRAHWCYAKKPRFCLSEKCLVCSGFLKINHDCISAPTIPWCRHIFSTVPAQVCQNNEDRVVSILKLVSMIREICKFMEKRTFLLLK